MEYVPERNKKKLLISLTIATIWSLLAIALTMWTTRLLFCTFFCSFGCFWFGIWELKRLKKKLQTAFKVSKWSIAPSPPPLAHISAPTSTLGGFSQNGAWNRHGTIRTTNVGIDSRLQQCSVHWEALTPTSPCYAWQHRVSGGQCVSHTMNPLQWGCLLTSNPNVWRHRSCKLA